MEKIEYTPEFLDTPLSADTLLAVLESQMGDMEDWVDCKRLNIMGVIRYAAVYKGSPIPNTIDPVHKKMYKVTETETIEIDPGEVSFGRTRKEAIAKFISKYWPCTKS